MKKDIHPKYEEITASCSCGNVMKIRSTVGHDLNLDVCSKCHPFFTGTQKLIDTGGRVQRFADKFGSDSVPRTPHSRSRFPNIRNRNREIWKKRRTALFLCLNFGRITTKTAAILWRPW